MIKEEFNLVVKVKDSTRLGRPRPPTTADANEDEEVVVPPRLLRIELEDLGVKKQILARAKDLRSSEHEIYSQIFIRPDLTKAQQEI